MDVRHVPDLEQCQELDRLCKEKNITLPETEFYWKVGKASGHANLTTDKPDLENWTKTDDGFDWYHAPLVSELGELLPNERKDKLAFFSGLAINGWFCEIKNYQVMPYERFHVILQEVTEANARQKMINHLIAEGIITKL